VRFRSGRQAAFHTPVSGCARCSVAGPIQGLPRIRSMDAPARDQILATGVTPVSVNTVLRRLEYLRAYVEEFASTPSRNNPARAQTINGGAFRFSVFPYRRIHRLESRILAKRREARLQFCVVPPILQSQVIGG